MGLSAAAGRMEAVGKYLKAGMVTGAELRLFFAGKVREVRRGCVSGRREKERSEDGKVFFSIFIARYRDRENAGNQIDYKS